MTKNLAATLTLLLLAACSNDRHPKAIAGVWDCGVDTITLTDDGTYEIQSGKNRFTGTFTIEEWKDSAFGMIKADKPVYPLSEYNRIIQPPNAALDLITSMKGLMLYGSGGAFLQCRRKS